MGWIEPVQGEMLLRLYQYGFARRLQCQVTGCQPVFAAFGIDTTIISAGGLGTVAIVTATSDIYLTG